MNFQETSLCYDAGTKYLRSISFPPMNPINRLAALFFACSALIACESSEEKVIDADINQQDCLTASSVNNGEIIEGEYIASTGDDTTIESNAVETLLSERKLTGKKLSDLSGKRSMYLLKLKREEAEKLRKQKVKIEPDRIISACGCFSVVEAKTITWNIESVGYGDGRGKTAWIIDSGVDMDHPDLNVDLDRSRSYFADNSIDDENGHGTHIAGIIGALNNDFGTLGVASGASIVALKVLDENGEGKLSALMNALAYVKANAKAGDVVNISISFPQVSEILEEEIQAIAAKGIYFTLAAGNEESDIDSYSPARTAGKNIYTVSAVDSLKEFARFSNYGSGIEFAAPGVNITSTYKDGKYARLNGTSMAAPHVAGLLLINGGTINSSGFATADPDGDPDPVAHK